LWRVVHVVAHSVLGFYMLRPFISEVAHAVQCL
jgi:hypothetical protein